MSGESHQLVRYEAFRQALVEAHSVDEVLEIRDRAEAARAAARIAGDLEMVNMAAEIRIRAERRAGELLGEMKQDGILSQGKADTLSGLGIQHHESSRWQKCAAVPKEAFEQYVAETKAEGRELTSSGVRKLAKQAAPEQRIYDVSREYCTQADLDALANTVDAGDHPGFGTVYADPPWRYGNQGTRGATGDHYPGMSVDEICALPVAKLAASNAHIHLWTTNAFLFEAHRVMSAWGFEYKSCYVWVKPQIGMGNYWRVSHEFMLFGVRGSLPFADRTLRSWGEFNSDDETVHSIEIKAEEHWTGNLFIERWSNRHRQTDGWLVTLDCDLLLYHFLETDRCLVLNFQRLRRWVLEHEARFRLVDQKKYKQLNDTWGLLVPVHALPLGLLLNEFSPAREKLA